MINLKSSEFLFNGYGFNALILFTCLALLTPQCEASLLNALFPSKIQFKERVNDESTTAVPSYSSTYSSELASNSSIFSRPDGDVGKSYYYKSIQTRVTVDGNYVFTSNSTIDTMGFVYGIYFDPSVPLSNLLAEDDDSGGRYQFRIRIYLHAGENYVLVVTTHSGLVTGDFSILAVGPSVVSLSEITPTTIRPIPIQTTASGIETFYLNSLSTTSQSYVRPNGNAGGLYYFHAIQVTVLQAGSYTLKSSSSIDTFGFLYGQSFDPSYPLTNLITQDDDSGGQYQFRIRAYLQTNVTYILVVTTHPVSTTGNFSISVVGPSNVFLVSITPSTSLPASTLTTSPSISSSYSNILSSTSLMYQRPDGDNGRFYYFQSIQLTISVTGTYNIKSISGFDTMGFIYDTSFDPSNPTANLFAQDDDSGGQFQFRLRVYLHNNQNYILVVTTHRPDVTGNYSLSVDGPSLVNLNNIVPSTSRPIITPTQQPIVLTSYSNSLAYNSPIFQRPDGTPNVEYYYHDISVVAPQSGIYIFQSNSSIDTVGYFYTNGFDPSSPLINLIAEDDDNGDISLQFSIRVYLQSGRSYVLVVTTHRGLIMGNFTVSVTGLSSVSLRPNTSPTTRPPLTPSPLFFMTSSYTIMLAPISPKYIRLNSESKANLYYFGTIELTVSVKGSYSIKSNAYVDTIGYLHDTYFDPTNPQDKLITFDDDSGINKQFIIDAFFETEKKYILVVTTKQPLDIGVIWITSVGQTAMNFGSYYPTIVSPLTNPPATTISTISPINTDRPSDSSAQIKINLSLISTCFLFGIFNVNLK